MIGSANTLNLFWTVHNILKKNYWNLQVAFILHMIRSMYNHGLSVLLWQIINEGEADES